MERKKASLCHRCGYAIQGVFQRCLQCGSKDVSLYAHAMDPALTSRLRQLQGYREPAHPALSMLLVGALTGLAAFVYAMASTDGPHAAPELKQLYKQVVAVLH